MPDKNKKPPAPPPKTKAVQPAAKAAKDNRDDRRPLMMPDIVPKPPPGTCRPIRMYLCVHAYVYYVRAHMCSRADSRKYHSPINFILETCRARRL